MDGKKHIAFCVSDNYVQYICVTIQSILENNRDSSFVIHIITDKISQESKLLLDKNFNGNQDIEIVVHEIDDARIKGLKQGRWTKYAWYRILIPEILISVDKILYLDADTIVNGDLTPLFSYNLEGIAIAGVLDDAYIKSDDEKKTRFILDNDIYFCSGVLLMNLDYWRKNNISKKIINFSLEVIDKLQFPDQDAINYICSYKKLRLPFKYGISTLVLNERSFYEDFYKEIKEAYISPSIIHFASLNKSDLPWYIESNHIFKSLWLKYNNLLESKVKVISTYKGWGKLKILLWNILFDRGKKEHEYVKLLLSSTTR